MLPKKLPRIAIISLFLTFLLFVILSFQQASFVFSSATHAVISEVQIGGTDADDEFVELYNPTATDVIMSGWRLTRINSTGTEGILISNLSGTIPAHGFFLTSSAQYDGGITRDVQFSNSSNHLAANHTVILYSDAGVTEVDRVGLGASVNAEGNAPVANPTDNGSVERKPGANDPLAGNGQDTENNANDFIPREVADPQNTSSATETEPEPTESPTPSPTPTEEPTPTPTIEPTTSPTVEPTATPTAEPTATPTSEPTVSPTAEPSITPSPTPLPLPTPTLLFDRNGLACWIDYVPIQVRWWHTFILRRIICSRG